LVDDLADDLGLGLVRGMPRSARAVSQAHPDTATAYDAVLRLLHAKDLLADLDPTLTGHALERLHATVAGHDTGSGVFFGARAWLVAAVRRPNAPARA
jgi:hypothetical protein